MIHAQNAKFVSVLTPATITAAGTGSGIIDGLGFDEASVFLHCATQTAGNTHTIVLDEGDTTSAFTTNADLTIATVTPSTSATQAYGWHIDLRKRKRYLRLTVTVPGTAQVVAASAILTRAEQMPTSIAQRGLTAQKVS
jgi:hypothetical protein